MRIVVDRNRCEAYGMCETAAPRVFQVDESDTLQILPFEESEVDPEALRSAIANCPKNALSIVD